jgi:hypothetical protein
MTPPLRRRMVAEYLGSAFLAALVIGSGIAAARLSSDEALRLLEADVTAQLAGCISGAVAPALTRRRRRPAWGG